MLAYDVNARQQLLRERSAPVTREIGSFPQPVLHHARQHGLHVFRNHMAAIVNERPGPGTVQQGQGTAGRKPESEHRSATAVSHQTLHVLDQQIRDLYLCLLYTSDAADE